MQGRQVQTLRIRAHRPAQAQHAAVELEDALRTASFGNLPRNGVVYIRRLDLGKIGPRPARAELSRQVERVLRALPTSAIRCVTVEDDLPEADAVWFPTPAAALCVVAERILQGLPLRAWYWRRVLSLDPVRRVAVDMATVISRAEQIAPAELTVLSLLRHLAALGELPALARQLPESLLRRQRGWLQTRVVRAAPLADAPPVAEAGTFSAVPMVQPGAARLEQLTVRLPAGYRLQIMEGGRRYALQPERLQWLVLLSHELAAQRLTPDHWRALESLTCEPVETPQRGTAANGVAASPATTGAAASPRLPVPDTSAWSAAVASVEAARSTATGAGHTMPNDPYAPRFLQRRPFPETDFNWAGSWLWQGQPTPVAGLMFLWPVWQRLGLAQSLDDFPWLRDAGLPWYLLLRLRQWLMLPRGEPMLAWLGPIDRQLSGEWRAPDAWQALLAPQLQRHGVRRETIAGQHAERALAGRVLLRLDGPADAAREQLPLLADSWLRLSARWLYQHQLRLRRLVERPGVIAATDTHVDIGLTAEHSDLLIRKLGLDIDPGWVPCLGKVVQYHYVRREDSNA